MKWEEVRKLYPDQYVKLNILAFYVEDGKKIVTDVALIDVIESSERATKELLKSKSNTIVYHTGSERIAIEMRSPTGFRGMRLSQFEMIEQSGSGISIWSRACPAK